MVLSLLSVPFRIHELIQFIAPVDRRRYFNRTKNTLRRLLHILFIDTNLPGRKFQHPGGLTHQEGLVADTERRELPVETLRELRRDVYIRPNEGERKVYIFSDCGQLNERDQNVLLKIVEEGPPYAAFLFCTETSAALLETIRSRCVEWKLRGSGEVALSGRALELCRVLAGGSAFEAAAHLAKLESRRLTREQLQELLEQVWYVTVQAMKPAALRPAEESCAEAARAMRKALGQKRLAQLAQLLRRYAGECRFNVGVGHVLGALAASCEQIFPPVR